MDDLADCFLKEYVRKKFVKLLIVFTIIHSLKNTSGKDTVINKKYKLINGTKFILVLPTFLLIQQSLSMTRCSMKCLHSDAKHLSNGT